MDSVLTSSMPQVTAIIPQKRQPVPPSVSTKVKTLDSRSQTSAIAMVKPSRCIGYGIRQENFPTTNHSTAEAEHGDELEVPPEDLLLAQCRHVMLICLGATVFVRHVVRYDILVAVWNEL